MEALALALKYGPTVLGLIAQYGPMLHMALSNYSLLDMLGHISRSAVVATTNKDPVAQLGSFVGNLVTRMPELKHLEPIILQHLQANGDAVIRMSEGHDE